MERVVDVVAELVRLLARQRARRMPEHDAHEHVLLTGLQPDPLPRDRREVGTRASRTRSRPSPPRRRRSPSAARTRSPSSSAASSSGTAIERSRVIARPVRHRAVQREVAHLARDARVLGAQQPDVGDALAQHEDAIEPEPHREAGAGHARAAQHMGAGDAALADLDPLVAVLRRRSAGPRSCTGCTRASTRYSAPGSAARTTISIISFRSPASSRRSRAIRHRSSWCGSPVCSRSIESRR